MKIINLITLFLLSVIVAYAQLNSRQLVTFNYQNQPLDHVLSNISQEYGVRFSYSSDVVAVKKRVSLTVTETPLDEALNQLCTKAKVKYAQIGGQIVLKAAPLPPAKTKTKKVKEVTRIESPKLPERLKQQTPLYAEPEQEEDTRRAPLVTAVKPLDPLKRNTITSVPGGDRIIVMETNRFKMLAEKLPVSTENKKAETDNRLAQISILPKVGTNNRRSEEIINNVSVNLFWGANGGVDGLEVGGIFNHIEKDVRGIQVAGLGNHVNQDVIGTQASGLFNVANGKVEGVQASGLFNRAKEATAIQAAGLFNVTSGNFSGLQAAGIFNSSGRGAGVQIAGLMNANKGGTKTQISGLMNFAGDIDYAQISPLLNVAKKVKGFQIGIINVADSVSGVPIGLLNIVKEGYNKFELFSSESLVANMGLKLGARSFYNIFQVGGRWDSKKETDINGMEQSYTAMTWGLGYGIGTAITLNRHSILNIEAVGMHINEEEEWTEELNLLGQLRFIVDMRIGRSISIFAGPTGNVMVSERFDPDSNTFGSNIMPYTLFDETANGTNVKMWIGFSGGMRF